MTGRLCTALAALGLLASLAYPVAALSVTVQPGATPGDFGPPQGQPIHAVLTSPPNVPLTFLLVDHSIFRTFNQGALGMLKVEGPVAPEIYSSSATAR